MAHSMLTTEPDVVETTMRPRFRVWLRPRADFCRVRVDGFENSRWLLKRLGRSFVFRTFEPLVDADGGVSAFEIALNPPLSLIGLGKLLAGFREVQLIHERA